MAFMFDYNQHSARTILGCNIPVAENACDAAGVLELIARRIHDETDALLGVTNLLRDHADAVHGHEPEVFSEQDDPAYPGKLGLIHAALDRLSSVRQHLAIQAGRNSTLA